MKHLAFFLFVFALGVNTAPTVYAQEPGDLPVPGTKANNNQPLWLTLSQQIIPLEATRPYERPKAETEAASRVRVQAVLTLEQLTNQLRALPANQLAQAYRYLLEHATVDRFVYGSIEGLIGVEPTSDNLKFILSYFRKLPIEYQHRFLTEIALNGVMLYPEVFEFRSFPGEILHSAAQGAPVSRDLVSQSALLLVTNTSAHEKQLMHQALERDSRNGGLWNALTQLNVLNPVEVQKARELFALLKDIPGWRLTLAAALSPYDSQMSALVQQAVEAELKSKGNIDIMSILLQPNAGEKQMRELEQNITVGGLAILSHWELKRALPYLLQMLQAKNPAVTHLAMPILATRAPQEVLRVARLPSAREKFFNLDFGVGLVGLLFPQLQPEAAQILSKGEPQEEGVKGYGQVIQKLRERKVMSIF